MEIKTNGKMINLQSYISIKYFMTTFLDFSVQAYLVS